MKITINISDALLRSAQLRAAETDKTLAVVIEDALRLALEARTVSAKVTLLSIPTSGEGGLLPGVDLDDTSALLDLTEDRP